MEMRATKLCSFLVTCTFVFVLDCPISLCAKGDLLRKLKGITDPPTTDSPSTTVLPFPTSPTEVVRQRLGKTVNITKYNNQMYKGSDGGPIATGDDLQCNFDGVCCWDNVISPTDQFDWVIGKGQPDLALFHQNFGTPYRPSGKYLMVTEPRSSATNEAMFVSCTVACSSRTIQVKFMHWTTAGVQLQVCSSDTFFNDHNRIELINCKDVRRSTSTMPTTVSIPPGELVDIVFVASNFRNNHGGVAIIDNIVVDITPCPNKHAEEGSKTKAEGKTTKSTKTTPSVHRSHQ